MTGSSRGTWARWAAVTTLGYSLGLYAGFFLAHFLVGPLVAALAIGAAVGLAQRPVLQGFLVPRHSRLWSPAQSAAWVSGSVAGMALVFGSGWLLVRVTGLEEGPLGWLAVAGAFAIGGSVAGVLQERVLRRYTSRSGRWIPASALGWGASALGFGLVPALDELVYDLFVILLAPTTGGAVLGLITGYALVRLPRKQSLSAPPGAPPSTAIRS